MLHCPTQIFSGPLMPTKPEGPAAEWGSTSTAAGTKGFWHLISNLDWGNLKLEQISRTEILSLWCVLLGVLIMKEVSFWSQQTNNNLNLHSALTLSKNMYALSKCTLVPAMSAEA